MAYKDNYKSIQLNLLRNRHSTIIEWLEKRRECEERSFNSLILQLIKEAYESDLKDEKHKI